MRIMQLAPLWERVPPPGYGGIELVVALLTDELVRMGHEVVLAASGDSETKAKLFSVHGRSLRSDASIRDPWPYTWLHVAAALREARDFDLVHNHASELAMAMHALSPVPMLTTLHNAVTNDAAVVWRHYMGWWNTPSRAARRGVDFPNFAGTIYHGIDLDAFLFREKKDDYLLFLSRMSPEKGPRTAIEVARRAGKKLIMAGKVDGKDRAYFEAEVAPLIDGKRVEFLGEADQDTKRELFAGASCLLFPITWNEPFGLVMVEAMASGTPVVAFRHGAAPEVVWHGHSGFIVDDVEQMVAAVRSAADLAPSCIREYVTRRFSAPAMARGYVRVYQRILEQAAERPRRLWPVAPPPALAG